MLKAKNKKCNKCGEIGTMMIQLDKDKGNYVFRCSNLNCAKLSSGEIEKIDNKINYRKIEDRKYSTTQYLGSKDYSPSKNNKINFKVSSLCQNHKFKILKYGYNNFTKQKYSFVECILCKRRYRLNPYSTKYEIVGDCNF